MKKSNQNRVKSVIGVASLVAMLALVVSPSFSYANDKIDVYYTFHNDLGGRVITDCQLGVDFMEEYFSPWIYDGEREWFVERVGLGFYSEYKVDTEEGVCTLYTNSFSVRAVLFVLGVPHVDGFLCVEQDLSPDFS